jgi:hypothetical protein
VVLLGPPPYPPLGPDVSPPAYPLAPPAPRGLRPTYAPPYPPLGNPPQWRQPDPPRVESTPAPPRASSPPPRPSRREADEHREVEQSIEAFCDAHPDEAFCGKLGAWMRAHPQR